MSNLRTILLLCAWTVASLDRATGIDHDISISVYQGRCEEGQFPTNLATVRRVTDEAIKTGSQFVVFPEAFLSGYADRGKVEQGARELQDPELTRFIADTAAHDVVVVVGLARRAGADLYNSVLVIQAGRLLGHYDKIQLTGGDREGLGFKPGTGLPIFRAHGVQFAVIICHDTSFPHPAMLARLQGAELLFTPHNNTIATNRVDDHRKWVRNCHVGLACQLKMVVARANIVQADRPGHLAYGDSFILNPQGEPLAEARPSEEQLITARVRPDMFKSPFVWSDLHEVPKWLNHQLAQVLDNPRLPADEADLRFWLENMVLYHRYDKAEVAAATGLSPQQVAATLARLKLIDQSPPARDPHARLRVLPYPGGRHPRIGFLDGAVAPQRETKVSVFTPWDEASYVVVDVPEAIFSNLGLTYLAHTHIPTIWSQQGITLARQEWTRQADGSLTSTRSLPNGIAFGATVIPTPTEVRMELWLRNGTPEKLTDLRVQNCVHLRGAGGFESQTLTNKLFRPPFAAARAESGNRWIITGWTPINRCWGNTWVPCLHADPRFPDCPSNQTVRARGWLSFFEGEDVTPELDRLSGIEWLQTTPPQDE